MPPLFLFVVGLVCHPFALGRSSCHSWLNPQKEKKGTSICAATLHNVFDLDSDYQSNLDFSKPGVEKVGSILSMKALLLDEAGRVELAVEHVIHVCVS